MLLGVDYQKYRYFVRNGFKYWNSYDEVIEAEVIEQFFVHHQKAGAWEISMNLKAMGFNVGIIQVKRYMVFNGLIPQVKTYNKPKFDKPVDTSWSENLVKDFNVEQVNKVWAHDNSEFKCKDGKLNVLVLEDLGSRECIN